MSEMALDVWVDEIRVGRLIQDNYEYIFQYEDIPHLNPQRHLVSLTMPVRMKQYDTQILMPPFRRLYQKVHCLKTCAPSSAN